MNTTVRTLIVLAALAAAGCIQVKTESEIKPIHITMDVNLKVDKELDKAFADESSAKPQGSFKEVKALLDRQAAGFTNRAMLKARDGATDDDRIFIAEENARRLKRFNEVAKSSGVSIDAVQKRRALAIREKLQSGAWYQDDAGAWLKK